MWVFFPLSSQKCFIEKYEKDNLALCFPPDGCSCTSISPACFIPGATGLHPALAEAAFQPDPPKGKQWAVCGRSGAPLLGVKTPILYGS